MLVGDCVRGVYLSLPVFACVPQRSRRLQQVVWRCAMRWKQRALCQAGRAAGGLSRKRVSFRLPVPPAGNTSIPWSREAEGGAGEEHTASEM